MLSLSKFFKHDIVSPNQTLKPVIIITNPETDDVLFTLTQDKEELLDNQGNKLDIISCISKVSNVRLSTDYDTKTLKINRLRCTLYNYFDIKTKLSEYINNSVINKNLFLFYKSPTSHIINTTTSVNDYDCALVYKGEISRFEFNRDVLSVIAEDQTQLKISNKKVPYMSVDRLEDDIKNNLAEQYQGNDTVVPMTFGKVDKAPTIVYYDSDVGNNMNILVDVFPTSGKYKTSKVPSLLDYNFVGNADYDYWLYTKDDDDYNIVKHWFGNRNWLTDFQYNLYSRFSLRSFALNDSGTDYLYPELSEDNLDEESDYYYDVKKQTFFGFNIRQPISATATDGSILGISQLQFDNISNSDFSNEGSLTDNANKRKTWYRQGDSFNPSLSFTSGYKTYDSSSEPSEGRWIVFRMEKGADNDLLSIGSSSVGYSHFGNTWLLSDWKITQQNTFSLTGDASRIGWFVTPIAKEVWGELDLSNPNYNILLQQINATDETELEELNSIDNDDPYLFAPIYMLKDDTTVRNVPAYFGTQSTIGGTMEWKNINGFRYGEREFFTVAKGGNASDYDLIAAFEYFPKNWEDNSNVDYTTELQMNNFGLMHHIIINDLSSEEIFASIGGRKNHLYTQELNPQVYEDMGILVEDIPFSYFLDGEVSDTQILNALNDSSWKAYQTLIREDESNVNELLNTSYAVGGDHYFENGSISSFKTRLTFFTLSMGGG